MRTQLSDGPTKALELRARPPCLLDPPSSGCRVASSAVDHSASFSLVDWSSSPLEPLSPDSRECHVPEAPTPQSLVVSKRSHSNPRKSAHRAESSRAQPDGCAHSARAIYLHSRRDFGLAAGCTTHDANTLTGRSFRSHKRAHHRRHV